MRLENVTYRNGLQTWLHAVDLSLAPGEFNVLLGATLAGKTTLLRIMAGLDKPSSGRIFSGGNDVTGVPVRRRNVAMVYQQFINYPSLSVFENIASPLRVARKSEQEIRSRVGAIAETLRLTPFLSRYPAELSGGQQQRTALARALAKDAELLLLDEPLANLDYKLREQLREELAQLFKGRNTTVVYATTEPQEALQLGGHTAVLEEGKVLQFAPTLQAFNAPTSLGAARTFSDPPLNVIAATVDAQRNGATLAGDLAVTLPLGVADLVRTQSPEFFVGIRAHQLRPEPRGTQDWKITGQVTLAEIGGSDTFVHLARNQLSLVAQFPGVHELELGALCTLHANPADLYLFAADGSPMAGHGQPDRRSGTR